MIEYFKGQRPAEMRGIQPGENKAGARSRVPAIREMRLTCGVDEKNGHCRQAHSQGGAESSGNRHAGDTRDHGRNRHRYVLLFRSHVFPSLS